MSDPVAQCPLRLLFAIEAVVIGMDHAPVPDVALELRGPSGVLRSKTDADGLVRFPGLEEGDYALCPYTLDKDAWELVSAEAISESATKVLPASWQTPSDAAPASVEHVVAAGECVSKLAERFGLFPDTIWDDSANAALAKTRGDRNVLAPGDKLVIPAKRIDTEPASTGQRYTLRRLGVPETVRIRFMNGATPRAGVPFVMQLTMLDDSVVEDRTGSTDDDGFVVAPVPPGVSVIDLELGDGAVRETYQIRVGHLDPIESPSGVRARLRNLGYLGPVDDDAAARDALGRFQSGHGLLPSGESDAATRDALRAAFLS